MGIVLRFFEFFVTAFRLKGLAKNESNWIVIRKEYEGYPLVLRIQTSAESSQNKKSFQKLVVIEHKLEKVRSDGLPEPEYNRSLTEVDLEITAMFKEESLGVTALVETFCGRRIFYLYVKHSADVESSFNMLKTKYSEHNLSLFTKPDPHWGLIAKYKEDFPW